MKNTDKKEGRGVSQGEPGNEYTKQQSRTGSQDKDYDIASAGSRKDSNPGLKKGDQVNDEDTDDDDDTDDDLS